MELTIRRDTDNGMTTFDTPCRETAQVVQMQTNTPLQALVLLNNETFVEAARTLAQRIIHDGGDGFGSRLQIGFPFSHSEKRFG